MAFRSAEVMTLQDLHYVQKSIGTDSVKEAVEAFRRACEFHGTAAMLSEEVEVLMEEERGER